MLHSSDIGRLSTLPLDLLLIANAGCELLKNYENHLMVDSAPFGLIPDHVLHHRLVVAMSPASHDTEMIGIDPHLWDGATSMKVHSKGRSGSIGLNSKLLRLYYVVILVATVNELPMVLGDNDEPIGENETHFVNREIPRVCRENPDWPGSLHIKCSAATGFHPSTNVPSWLDEVDYWNNEYQYLHETRGCLTQGLAERWARILDEDPDDWDTEIPPPSITWSQKDEHDDPIVFELVNALSEHEARSIQVLAQCVRDISDVHFLHSKFGSGGGNDVTYMNFVLQKFLPGVASQLSTIIHMVHNATGTLNNPPRFFPHPSTLGIRTSEHLSYREFPDGLGTHLDSDSVFTVLVFLSDPDDYEGGEFFVNFKELGFETLSRPHRLSAMVFLSERAVHGVKPIPRGVRETFATEFWIYPDVPSRHRRPGGSIWELYMERVKEDPTAPFPTDEERDEFISTGRSIWSDGVPSPYGEGSANLRDEDENLNEVADEDRVGKEASADDHEL